MAFLPCPRLRKGYRPASPSGFALSYQSAQPRELPVTSEEHAQGALSKATSCAFQHLKQSPQGFTHRLRRRFSRERKLSGSKKPDHRENGKSFFSFSLKPSWTNASVVETELAALEDIGSSLMSERGYDSDAQYIATPKHISRVAEASLVAQGFRRLDLSDLVEQSHELAGSEIWTAGRASNVSEKESAFGLSFIPVLKSSLRGPRTAPYSTGTSSGDKSYSSPSLGGKQAKVNSEEKTDFVQSLPSLHLVSQDEVSHANVEPFPSIEVPLGINGQDLMADWIQFLRASRRNRGTESSGSYTDQTPGLVITKKRQAAAPGRLGTEVPSLHLDGLGISRMLDTRSASTGLLSGSLSIAEPGRPRKHHLLVPSSQDDIHACQPSDLSAVSGKKAEPHRRDASSFYSRQSSPLSVGTGVGAQSLRISSVNSPKKADTGCAAVESAFDERFESQKSKFIERFGTSPSEASELRITPRGSSELEPPRNVSIGWMSGGRRVGYGYTLVDEDEDELHASRPDGNAPSTQEMDRQPGDGAADINAGGNGEDEKQPNSMEDIVDPCPHSSLYNTDHEYRAELHQETTAPQAKEVPAPTNDGYGSIPEIPVSLWARLKSRDSKEQNHAAFAAENARAEDRVQTDSSQLHQEAEDQVPHELTLINDPNGSFMRRWARKGCPNSIQPRPRKDREDTHHGRKTWVLGAPRLDNAQDTTSMLADLAEQDKRDDLAANSRPSQHPGGSLDGPATTSLSRSGRWTARFSRYRGSKRISIAHTKESSDASSDRFHDCTSLNRTNSARSRAQEFASMYQEECLETMPGSFEGSARIYRRG